MNFQSTTIDSIFNAWMPNLLW